LGTHHKGVVGILFGERSRASDSKALLGRRGVHRAAGGGRAGRGAQCWVLMRIHRPFGRHAVLPLTRRVAAAPTAPFEQSISNQCRWGN